MASQEEKEVRAVIAQAEKTAHAKIHLFGCGQDWESNCEDCHERLVACPLRVNLIQYIAERV